MAIANLTKIYETSNNNAAKIYEQNIIKYYNRVVNEDAAKVESTVKKFENRLNVDILNNNVRSAYKLGNTRRVFLDKNHDTCEIHRKNLLSYLQNYTGFKLIYWTSGDGLKCTFYLNVLDR